MSIEYLRLEYLRLIWRRLLSAQAMGPPHLPYAGAAIPILAYHGLAPVIASFTALMFLTP